MHDLAIEQIGDGREPDMRMRPHVESRAGAEFSRSEMIEEDERPDHARARRRQGAAHREAVAEVDRARHDHIGERLAAIFVARDRVLAGKEAHHSPRQRQGPSLSSERGADSIALTAH